MFCQSELEAIAFRYKYMLEYYEGQLLDRNSFRYRKIDSDPHICRYSTYNKD